MFLLSTLAFGALMCIAYLIVKRIVFHNRPTPAPFAICISAILTLQIVFAVGFGEGFWVEAISHLFAMYAGLSYAMYIVGDLSYYRAKHYERSRRLQPQPAPEDDPDWSNYRP